MFIYVYIASFPPYLVHPYMRRATHSSLEVRACSVLHSRDKRSTPIRYGILLLFFPLGSVHWPLNPAQVAS